MIELAFLKTLSQNVGLIVGYTLAGLSALLASRVKDIVTKKRAKLGPHTAIRDSLRLQSFLAEARVTLDVDRISVSQFHNGEHFISGASVQKLTLTNFVMRPGISVPLESGNQPLVSIPASYLTHTLNDAFEKGYSVSQQDDTWDDWFIRYRILNGLATTVTCLVPGTTGARSAFGIIGFCFIEPRQPTEEEIHSFMEVAKRASAFV